MVQGAPPALGAGPGGFDSRVSDECMEAVAKW